MSRGESELRKRGWKVVKKADRFPLFLLTKPKNCGIILGYSSNGMSPSGKARDFDSRIRRFKSGHPSHDECLI